MSTTPHTTPKDKFQKSHLKPDETLLEYLRRNLNLCGTKLACGEGGCGACTVMVSDFKGGKVNNYSVNACIAPLASGIGI